MWAKFFEANIISLGVYPFPLIQKKKRKKKNYALLQDHNLAAFLHNATMLLSVPYTMNSLFESRATQFITTSCKEIGKSQH